MFIIMFFQFRGFDHVSRSSYSFSRLYPNHYNIFILIFILSVMIVIAGRLSPLRRNFEKSYLRSQGQDCDPGDEIAIAAKL